MATLSLLQSERATLVKQGAEAKVYWADVFNPPSVYFPPDFVPPTGTPSSSSSSQSQQPLVRDVSSSSTACSSRPSGIGAIPPSPPAPHLLKHRFPKTYRHPTLSFQLTASRVAMECRALLRCMRHGVNVPALTGVDLEAGVVGMEWVEGRSVRELLGGGAEGEVEEGEGAEEEAETWKEGEEEEDGRQKQMLKEGDQFRLMGLIGVQIARMHLADIVHGDLTTSNMMLRAHGSLASPSSRDRDEDAAKEEWSVGEASELVLIDFGLSFVSNLVEDKAVDLYVLERAFASTHPSSEHLFAEVLDSYRRTVGKAWEPIGKRLDNVRMRGRKRSMVG